MLRICDFLFCTANIVSFHHRSALSSPNAFLLHRQILQLRFSSPTPFLGTYHNFPAKFEFFAAKSIGVAKNTYASSVGWFSHFVQSAHKRCNELQIAPQKHIQKIIYGEISSGICAVAARRRRREKVSTLSWFSVTVWNCCTCCNVLPQKHWNLRNNSEEEENIRAATARRRRREKVSTLSWFSVIVWNCCTCCNVLPQEHWNPRSSSKEEENHGQCLEEFSRHCPHRQTDRHCNFNI